MLIYCSNWIIPMNCEHDFNLFFSFFRGFNGWTPEAMTKIWMGWSGSQWILRQKSCQFWGEEDFANQWQVWWGFSWVTTVTTKRPRENRGLVTSNHRDLMMIFWGPIPRMAYGLAVWRCLDSYHVQPIDSLVGQLKVHSFVSQISPKICHVTFNIPATYLWK